MTELELVLRNDPFETEYPSLVKEMLAAVHNTNHLYAQINKDGFCVVIYAKYLYVWDCNTENTSMPRAFKLTMPSTGLQYQSSLVCIYKKSLKKTPSILCISPEGIIRHWSMVDKPHKDHTLELNNEVAHSLVVFDEQNHVHRFVLCTTTGSYFFIEVFHDEDKKEHLVTRPLDLGSNSGIRRMTILLLGSSAITRENVLRIRPITNELSDPDAELMTLYHKSIRIYSVNETRLLFELNITDIVNEGLRLLGAQLPRDFKYNLLDAIVYKNGILMVLALSNSSQQELDFYLAYVSEQSIKSRRRVEYIFQVDVPEHLAILAPFHESSLPKVSLHIPNPEECAIVFPHFVLLISNVSNSNRSIIREEFNDFLLGVAIRNNLCHLILKDNGICALRRLPRLFDLSFWKKYRLHLQKPTGDFMGRDFEHLQQAFFTFCSKDLETSGIQTEKFASFSELNFSNLVVQFLKRFLNAAPINDSRWGHGGDSNYGQADKKVVIMSQLREKLSFYRMFFLCLCSVNLMKKLDVALSDQNEKTCRTLLVEFGEKLLAQIEVFDWVCTDSCPIVQTAIGQLARRFVSQYDHPTNTHLTIFDHFFKECEAFEEFIPEVVKCENIEMDKYGQDQNAKIRIVGEVGQVLRRIADAVLQARRADWSAKPSPGALTWINQPRTMKYFIQHLNMAFSVLARQPTTIGTDEELMWSDILLSTECLAQLVLGEQDQCQRNNSQIIAKFYEIGQVETATNLAFKFKDFSLLIRHSHASFNDKERQEYLDQLKERFKNDNFDLCLYEYYRKNGMYEYLLGETGGRLDDFLSHHENIGWIRNIESSHYTKAREILKNLAFEAKTAEKKATILALAKLSALCEDEVDPIIVSSITESMTVLEHQDAIDKAVAKRLNPTNRPLTYQEIINANLEEKTCSGFVKALLFVAHLFSSPVDQITEHEANKLVRQIYSAVFSVDPWKEFNAHDAEQFKLKADQTAVSSVLFRLSEMNLTQDLKNVLLPDIEHLNKIINLDVAHQKALKTYLFAELLAFKFYAEDQEMET